MKNKTIKNNVVWSTYLHRTELKNFQWDLKLPNDNEIISLSNRIKKKWFDDPIKIRYDHENFILDWHQRLKALNKLQVDWYMLEDDKVPVIFIKAETIEEAKEKVYEYNSRFSVIDEEFSKDWWAWLDLDDLIWITWWSIIDDIIPPEPEEKWENMKDKEFCMKITSKNWWKTAIENLFKDIEPILSKYEWLIDYSFSWWEI